MRTFISSLALALCTFSSIAHATTSSISPSSQRSAVVSRLNKDFGKRNWTVRLKKTVLPTLRSFVAFPKGPKLSVGPGRPFYQRGTINLTKGPDAPKGADRVTFLPQYH